MAKAKRSAAKSARKRKSKAKASVQARRRGPRKSKLAKRKSAARPMPAQGITAKLGNAIDVVVDTIKETTELRRKMHADQREE